MKPPIWITALAVLILSTILGAVLAVFYFSGRTTNSVALETIGEVLNINADNFGQNNQSVKVIDNKAPQLVDQAFEHAVDYQVDPKAKILLVPHHMVAAREIASLLSAAKEPRVVYFLAPDHFSAGRTPLTTAESDWQTSAGNLQINYKQMQSLTAELPELGINDQVISEEIATQALFPYIAKAWPDARIVPILVRNDANPAIREQLADVLVQRLEQDKHAIILSTVDFSHYLPAEVADFHDILASDVLQSLADLEVDKIELDSANVLGTTLIAARKLNLGAVNIHANTNSLKILNSNNPEDATSHFLASFAPGQIQDQQSLTLLFFGDMMFDRVVASRSNRSGSLSYPFDKIKGKEDRFLSGQDFIIANLEGPVAYQRQAPDRGEYDFLITPEVADMIKSLGVDAVSQANNHTYDQGNAGAAESRELLQQSGLSVFGDQLRDDAEASLAILESRGQTVALLGFNTTNKPLNKADALVSIATAASQSDYQVAFMHWGEEYEAKPNQSQIAIAHWLIDNGVDAVIGSHPHWMQSVEVYNDVPIVYSLGNFIFDQDWSKETNLGLVAGLALSKQGSELHLYPIQITQSQPTLLLGSDRQKRLNRLAEISDPDLADQIRTGVLY